MTEHPVVLPELQAAHWFNTEHAPSLQSLRGQVVVVHAFQMLCPGCVAHGLPQAAAIDREFAGHGVAVIGLHSVFEHHDAQAPHALQAFLHEYRVRYPVAVDRPGDTGPVPQTMRAWRLRGTPSLLIFDAKGHLRMHEFGQVDDLKVGATLGALLAEAKARRDMSSPKTQGLAPACDDDGCALPEEDLSALSMN